ncbi:hypothetical protein RW1_038_00530 [Rhodococcus wratislaviensis NBRC 100605]|uniref:Uncharacterized protein n=1 Tax=Rhodococcus wratislaviensis NBRC 100605 TaxID=1219028 RepID=X0Q6X2_RHOWR|nr:hypothetical protein RW1_038_00530 [Rhodococcus wratislaviensis NBRC 100605]
MAAAFGGAPDAEIGTIEMDLTLTWVGAVPRVHPEKEARVKQDINALSRVRD